MRKYIITIAILIAVSVVFMGMFYWGTPQKLAPEPYIQWCKVEANGLKPSKTINDLSFITQYKSQDFLRAQKKLVENQVMDRSENDSMLYFNFRIENAKGNTTPLKYNSPTESQYFQRLNYLTFDIERDFKVIEGQDTLSCGVFQFVQNYSLAPYIDYVLGFPRKSPTQKIGKESIQFIYDDKVFGVGKIRLQLNRRRLQSIPKLKL